MDAVAGAAECIQCPGKVQRSRSLAASLKCWPTKLHFLPVTVRTMWLALSPMSPTSCATANSGGDGDSTCVWQ